MLDFQFLLNINLLTFLLAFVIFGIWEIVKAVYRKNTVTPTSTGKEIDSRLIVSINAGIAVIYAVLVVAMGLSGDVFAVLVNASAVFAAGSYFDLLKAYGAIKS
jgi:hypothetical protein